MRNHGWRSQELFAAMDTNNDGKIDSNDLHNALEKVRRWLGRAWQLCAAGLGRGHFVLRALVLCGRKRRVCAMLGVGALPGRHVRGW